MCNDINPDDINSYDKAQECYSISYALNILLKYFYILYIKK